MWQFDFENSSLSGSQRALRLSEVSPNELWHVSEDSVMPVPFNLNTKWTGTTGLIFSETTRINQRRAGSRSSRTGPRSPWLRTFVVCVAGSNPASSVMLSVTWS